MSFTPYKQETKSSFTPISDSMIQKYEEQKKETGLKGFATGVGKGVLSSAKGALQLGENVGQGILGGVEKLTGLPVTSDKVYSEEAIQESADKGGLGKLFTEKNLEARGGAENVGKFAEQVAEYAIPASKLASASKGLGFARTLGTRALTSGTVGAVQSGEVGKEAGIAAATEVALPVVGKFVIKPVVGLLGRLTKGLASGVSGTSSNIIDTIIKNPKVAEQQTKKFIAEGGDKILEENSKAILNGIPKIKEEARAAYGAALETLKQTDIKPKEFKDGVIKLFDDYGSVVEGNTRTLNNVDFKDAVSIKRASSIFDKIQNVELNGKSLKSLIDTIKKMKYTNPGTEEGRAFNSFVTDVSGNLKNIINNSTDKLGEMNKAYALDMQMAESIEDIFGKVKFKNPKELNRIAQKVETLFSKKGLSPSYIEGFLNRIGINPNDFNTSEAIRQISSKGTGANTSGLSVGEVLQQTTKALVPPEVIRDIAIKFGKNEQVVKQILEKIAPTLRGAFIESLNSLIK